jgi:3-isopropylmalate dehydrogenase
MRHFDIDVGSAERWTECLNKKRPTVEGLGRSILIGVLPGEGVGPEIIGAALNVLGAVASYAGLKVELCNGSCIGREAERVCGEPLSQEVIRFCQDIFSRGGVILQGPGGGRFVYDLRKQFDLFFKISPIRIVQGLHDVSRFKPDVLRDVDILVTRENSGGLYQGRWEEDRCETNGCVARQEVCYTEKQVSRFLNASAALAKRRRGKMTVVWKEFGLPTVSKLWRVCAEEAAEAHDISFSMVDIDLMTYWLIQEPGNFDIIAAPNLFGDVLADLGAALLGARGVSFSGNYGEAGRAAYQTNHGAAYDLARTNRANPAGQIFSVAMMLRESFALIREAACIEEAIRSIWDEGWRTEDVAVPGKCIVGTREFGCRVAERAVEILVARQRSTSVSFGNEAATDPG